MENPFEQDDDFAQEEPNEGYLIVLKPDVLLAQYSRLPSVIEYSDYTSQLRKAFASFDPSKYRGVSRDPLPESISLEQKTIDDCEASGLDMKTNARARRRLLEINTDKQSNPLYPDGLIETLDQAREVWSLLDVPSEYEIIHTSKAEFGETDELLGYDIGYWSGDHFSLIADTIVIPRWHAPAPEDFAELNEALTSLNEHLLFDTAQAAETFRERYLSWPWAEKEMEEGEFCIIRVTQPTTTA